MLGRVVEVVSGQTLFQFEKQRLFDPLGMTETAYYVADKAKWPRIAWPFPSDRFAHPLVGIRIRHCRGLLGIRRCGSVTTIVDYARFLQMLLNKGELDGKRYLKPETVALMTSDQIGPETGIVPTRFTFRARPAALVLVLPYAPRRRRIQPGHWVNIAGTARNALLLCEPRGRHVRCFHGVFPHSGRADSTGARRR